MVKFVVSIVIALLLSSCDVIRRSSIKGAREVKKEVHHRYEYQVPDEQGNLPATLTSSWYDEGCNPAAAGYHRFSTESNFSKTQTRFR